MKLGMGAEFKSGIIKSQKTIEEEESIEQVHNVIAKTYAKSQKRHASIFDIIWGIIKCILIIFIILVVIEIGLLCVMPSEGYHILHILSDFLNERGFEALFTLI